MSGKWHVTPWPGPGHNHPRRRGFDRFYGILASIRSYYNPPSLMRDDEPLPPPDGDYHFTDAVSEAAAGSFATTIRAGPSFCTSPMPHRTGRSTRARPT